MADAPLSLWVKRLIARFQGNQQPRRAARRPGRRSLLLEMLEQRDCPSGFNQADLLVVTSNSVSEFTSGGNLVQSFSVDYPSGRPAGETARGVVVGPGGQAYVFNGTFSPYLSAIDPTTGSWTHSALPSWMANVQGYGELGQYQQYVFAPDMNSPNGGIIRFDTATSTATPFATSTQYDNVTVGLDGNVYAIQASSTVIDIYDPTSTNMIGSVTVSGDPRGVAVDAAGNIFTADWSGVINEFDSNGTPINSLNPADGNLTSIALRADGQVIVGGRFGDVIVTDESLASDTIFPTSVAGGSEAYVAFVDPQGTAPAITSLDHTTFNVGSLTPFTVHSTASPTASLSEVGALPGGVTFVDNGDGTAYLTGTPDAGTGGVYTFTVVAHNGVGSDAAQPYTLTIDEAPSITSLPIAGFTVGAAGTFTVTTGHDYPSATTLQLTGTLPAGITFTDNGDGTATLAGTPATGTAGSYSLTITAGNGVGSDASQPFTLTVGLKSVTNLTVSPAAPVYGQPLTFVAAVAPGAGTATLTGTVTFYDGNTPVGSPVTLVGNRASLTTTAVAAGSHSFTAVYSGGGLYRSSTSLAVSKSFTVATTRVSLVPSSFAPVYGQPVTFTAKVYPIYPSVVTPTGTITFMDGTNPVATLAVNNGVATLSNQTLSVGKHPLTAVFTSNNASETGSTSAVLNETIGLARSTISLSVSPKPAVVGQLVTITAHIAVAAPGSANPSGVVTFKDGLTVLGTAPVINGVATLATSSLSANTHTFLAYYGNDAVTTTTMSAIQLLVSRASTTVDLSSSPSTGLATLPLTLTANLSVVAPGVAVPTGTIAFFRNGVWVGSGVVSNGSVSFTAPKMAAGTYHFTAVYHGDSKSAPSTSASWAVVINPVGTHSTTITLGSDGSPAPSGSPVTFTAQVDPVLVGDPVPTGTVSFYDGAVFIGSTQVAADGSATSAPIKLGNGTHSITARYTGDITFSANTSAPFTQVVQVGTITNLSSSTLAPVFGQTVTITARVSTASYSSSPLAGTVTFMDGATPLATVNLVSGVATFSSHTLAVGSHAVTAIFTSTNVNHAGSTSLVFNENIGLARTTVSFSASPSPAVVGQLVTLTVHVSVNSPGVATPTGNVIFKDGVTTLGTVAVDSSGNATFTTSSLAAGSHTFTLTYGGDTDTAGTTNFGKLTVNAASTTVSLNSSPQFGVAGQSVTLTAHVAVVAPGVATPTGTVYFYQGTQLLGTGAVDSNGNASYTTPKLAAGTYGFTANYHGDSKCAASASSSWSIQMVNAPVISSVTIVSSSGSDPSGEVTIGNLVNATVVGSDPQGLPVTYTYVWMVNGSVVATHAGLSTTDSLDPSTVPGLAPGDAITVAVTPDNGVTSGSAVTSNSLSFA
jgi:hypothetical protein